MSHFSPLGEFLSQYGDPQVLGSSAIGTPGGLGEDDWIASTIASEDHENSQQLSSGPLDGSAFLPFEDWEQDREYPDTYLKYTLEWKIVVKTRSILTMTEQSLRVSPSSFWVNVLQVKLEEFVKKRRAAHKFYEPESTKAVLSVTERKVRDVKKHFEQLEIDWPSLERQLENWATFFRSGKELRLDLTFVYDEVDDIVAPRTPQTARKQGSSTTRRMLNETNRQVDAEIHSLGRPATWRHVYQVLRCPGHSCKYGKWCLYDLHDRHIHYPLAQHHMKAIIDLVNNGLELETQADLPFEFREQVYAEARRQSDRILQKTKASSSQYPDININVLHAQSPTSDNRMHEMATTAMGGPKGVAKHRAPVELAGLRDCAVKQYCVWLQSMVECPRLKEEFRKARDQTLEDGFTLPQVYEDNDPDYYIRNGIKAGIARQWVDEVAAWAEHMSTHGN